MPRVGGCLHWSASTDPYLTLLAASEFSSREYSDERVWGYRFKDETGKVISGRVILTEGDGKAQGCTKPANGGKGRQG